MIKIPIWYILIVVGIILVILIISINLTNKNIKTLEPSVQQSSKTILPEKMNGIIGQIKEENSDESSTKEYMFKPRKIELYFQNELVDSYISDHPVKHTDGWNVIDIQNDKLLKTIMINGEHKIIIYSNLD